MPKIVFAGIANRRTALASSAAAFVAIFSTCIGWQILIAVRPPGANLQEPIKFDAAIWQKCASIHAFDARMAMLDDLRRNYLLLGSGAFDIGRIIGDPDWQSGPDERQWHYILVETPGTDFSTYATLLLEFDAAYELFAISVLASDTP